MPGRTAAKSQLEKLEPRTLYSTASELLDDIHDGRTMPAPAAAPQAATPIAAAAAPAAATGGTMIFPSTYVAAKSAPTARFEGYNFVYNGKLWCTGGFDANFKVVPGADIYDPNTNTWTSRADIRLRAAETHAGLAIDGKYVYFAGGYFGDLLPGRQQPISNSVWRWLPENNAWKRVASLPEGRGGGALVKVGRELHYFGGCLADRVTDSGVHWMLSLGKTSSASDDGTQWVQKRSLPKGRDHLSGVALGGKIYAIGGEFGHDVLSDQKSYVHCYDPKKNKWTRVASLLVAKSHTEAGTSVFGDKIIVGGGQVTGRGATGDVEQYDPTTNTWTRLSSLPEPRQGGAVQPMGARVVVALGAVQTTQPMADAWVGNVRFDTSAASTPQQASNVNSNAATDESTQAKLLQMTLAVAQSSATVLVNGPDGKPMPLRCTCPLCTGLWNARPIATA